MRVALSLSRTVWTLSGSPPLARSLRLSSSEEYSRRASRRTAAVSSCCRSPLKPGSSCESAPASRPDRPKRRTLGSLGSLLRALRILGRQQLLADLALDLLGDLRMLRQEYARVLLALTDALAAVAVPRARFLHQALRHADVDDLARARNARAVHDLEFGLTERRRHFVLHHLHAGLVADHFVAALDRADAADVQAHRGVELERVAAGGGFRVAEHHADLHADLVDEDDDRVRAFDVAGELAQRLRHEAGVQSDV